MYRIGKFEKTCKAALHYRVCVDLSRFQEIFLWLLKGPLPEKLDLGTEAVISYYMDLCPIQDSLRYRARHLGLRIANLLIDEKGELNRGQLSELTHLLDQTPFILGPRREGDALIYAHIRRCLHALDAEIWTWLKKFSPPLCHKKAEEIIRKTLWPETFRVVQAVHVRKAVMAAWLTPLRQTTGSCFATAPAILVQGQSPIRFFKDLYDLLSTGQLKRTVAGKEYGVPLSLTSGMGELQRIATGLENSPGLKIALESVGVSLTSSLQQKIRERGAQTIEKLLRILLLEQLGITEEDVVDEEHLSRIQMTPLLAKQTAVYYQRPSERAQKVTEWKKKLAMASEAFIALTDCALLRSWEYTIASFCDVKTEFARWNLYIGLGLHPEQKGGIGAFLYGQVDGHLQKCNREIESLSREYQQELASIQALELMAETTTSEMRRNQLKSEWMSHNLSANSIAERRAGAVEKAEGLVSFFSSLIEQYDQKLQEYFQELFDPALLGEEAPVYEDSPAGFRLVYKHGRADASQWTLIYTGEQYVGCLRDFFSIVEPDIATPPQLGRELVAGITTALIQFIQSSAFLSSAMERSRALGRKSPWDYISGGTMQALLQAYCNRSQPFTEKKIVPHSAEELLDFLIEQKEGPLLMQSPTHAFIVYPEWLKKVEGSFVGAYEPFQLAKMVILERERKVFFSTDWDQEIAEEMRRSGLAPRVLLFGDTNWSGWFFGFVANPETGQMELWRLNRNGMQGFPMADWKEYLSETNTSPWILLSDAKEYRAL